MKRLLLLVTILMAAPAQAYEILESRYRVETAPGVLEDQLVLRCDDGRKLVVSWEARLSEVCAEVAYSDHTVGGTAAPSNQDKQKEDVISRVREQPGNIGERHLQFQPSADGVDVQFSPQTREILKRYELCRKQTKGSPVCAAERDQALAALSGSPANAPAADSVAPAASEPPVATKTTAAQRKSTAKRAKQRPADSMPEDLQADMQPAAAAPTAAAAPAQPAAPERGADHTAAEQKIMEDYNVCMRAKPRFECEQARAAALKALERPKAKSGKAATTGKSGSMAATN